MTWAFNGAFDRSAAELEGTSPDDWFGVEGAACFRELADSVLVSGRSGRMTMVLPVGGDPRRYDVYAEPIASDDGVDGVACVATELSPE